MEIEMSALDSELRGFILARMPAKKLVSKLLLAVAVVSGIALNVSNAAEDPQNGVWSAPPIDAQLAIKQFKAPDNFKVDLFAAEPQLMNPVAFCLDEQGRVFVAETFRYKTSVLDIRDY